MPFIPEESIPTGRGGGGIIPKCRMEGGGSKPPKERFPFASVDIKLLERFPLIMFSLSSRLGCERNPFINGTVVLNDIGPTPLTSGAEDSSSSCFGVLEPKNFIIQYNLYSKPFIKFFQISQKIFVRF